MSDSRDDKVNQAWAPSLAQTLEVDETGRLNRRGSSVDFSTFVEGIYAYGRTLRGEDKDPGGV
jgi:hypothetical protein